MSKTRIKRPVVLLAVAFNALHLAFCGFGGRPPDAAPRSGPPHEAPGAPSPTVVSYQAAPDGERIVYPAEDLLLLEESGRSLRFAPIHTPSGTWQGTPGVVHLRLYSHAVRPQYESYRQLRLTVDGRVVWANADPFHSLTREGTRTVESLSGLMRVEEFARAVEGRVVKLAVGREEFELSWAQLSALRRMAECARGGACG